MNQQWHLWVISSENRKKLCGCLLQRVRSIARNKLLLPLKVFVVAKIKVGFQHGIRPFSLPLFLPQNSYRFLGRLATLLCQEVGTFAGPLPNNGINREESLPFVVSWRTDRATTVRSRTENKQPRALDRASLDKLQGVTFEPYEVELETTRNLFLLSCYTGVAYCEMREWEQIKQNSCRLHNNIVYICIRKIWFHRCYMNKRSFERKRNEPNETLSPVGQEFQYGQSLCCQ